MQEKELRSVLLGMSRGSASSTSLFWDTVHKEAKRANMRMLRLERSGLADASNAYQRAALFNDIDHGSMRFRFNKSMTVEELGDAYREMRTFLSKEESTVRGVRYAQKRFMQAMEDYGIEIPKEQQSDFFTFYRSDEVQDMIEYVGEYDVIADLINNAVNKMHTSLETLRNEFNSVLAGDQYFDEVVRKYGAGESYGSLLKRHRRRGINGASRQRGRKRK